MRRSLVVVGLAVALALSACGADANDASSPEPDATTIATTTDAAIDATTSAPANAPATTGGSSTGATTTVAEGGFPVTVTAGNGEITLDAAPDAIVSLSPTATEMLFAIGAGDRVVAVDDLSTYPPEAPITNLSGFNPNVEAIAGEEPDLVVVAYDANGVIGGLEALEIPVLQLDPAATLDDAYAQIELLGEVTDNAKEAAGVVAEMQDGIADVTARVQGDGLTYFHELDDLLFTVTSETFLGELYGLLGLVNVADPADADGSGYPQLSTEYLLDADPDLVFLADMQSLDTVAQRPGWRQLGAVQSGNVFPLDDDIASRWGPRVVELLEAVASAVEQATT